MNTTITGAHAKDISTRIRKLSFTHNFVNGYRNEPRCLVDGDLRCYSSPVGVC